MSETDFPMTAISDEELTRFDQRLKGAIVLVTGAGNGIGKESALKFAAAGAKVAALDLDLAAAEVTTKEIVDAGGEAIALKVDINSWDDQLAAFEATVEKFGAIDIVAAIAGIPENGGFTPKVENGKPAKPNMKTLEVDLIGTAYTIYLAQHYLPAQVSTTIGTDTEAQKPKALVVMASMATWHATPGGPLYGAAKLGLLGLVRSLAKPLRKAGVRTGIIHPFFADTAMTSGPLKALLAGLPLNPVPRIAASVLYAATSSDDTDGPGAAYFLLDDGAVQRVGQSQLKAGVYAALDARLNKVYGF